MSSSSPLTTTLLLATALTLAAAPDCPAAGLAIAFAADGATLSDTPSGAPAAAGGLHYSGSLVLPAAEVTFDVTAVDSADLFLSGTLALTSHLATPVAIDVDLTHGLDVPAAAFVRRSSVVGLVPFGGSVSSQPGQLMHEHLADGAASPGLLPAAFTSSGTIGPLSVLDASDIAVAGATASFGHRLQVILEPGATVVLGLTMRAQSMDLDQDGAIGGADLGLLLQGWGLPGEADFNGDGVVDSADLGLLLNAWG